MLNFDSNLRLQRPLLAPSLLSADFMRLGEELAFLESVDPKDLLVHVDVMDGRFVPNLTVGLPVVEAMAKVTNLPLDCHLMVVEPSRYASAFVQAGAQWVSLHQEAEPHLHRALAAIREAGALAGVVLNPATPIESLVDLAGCFDFVLLMSVNPGFGGQRFIEHTLDKVRRLHALRQAWHIPFAIQVDGGVGPQNAAELVRAGADILVAGNAIFKAPNPRQAIQDLQTEISKGMV